MGSYFVVGDIHGKAGMLEELMTHWMVSLGWFSRRLIDRGEDSRRVIELVKDFVDHQGAICLSGNHEYMFFSLDR